MSVPKRVSWLKRIFLVLVALVAFVILCAITARITINEMFSGGGMESSRRPAATSWDLRSNWATYTPMLQKSTGLERAWETPVARSADVLAQGDGFEQSVAQLRATVAAHQGFFEDSRTQSQSGAGRALAATLAVPAKEFDGTLADLKQVGRVEAVSEAGEDAAVKLATAERHVGAARTNLARLQRLQRERRGELRDAVALEKDIAQANEGLAEAERQHEVLASTVAQAHIRFTLIEDYRAPLEANLAGNFLALRNSAVEGIGAIFSSVAVILGVVFEYGLPLLFWAAILFLPGRYAWRRMRRGAGLIAAAS
jgi:hypothetical protein